MRFTSSHKIPSRRGPAPLSLIVCLLISALFSGCGEQTAVLEVKENEIPLFIDDSDRSALLACAVKQRDYIARMPANHRTTIENHTYPKSWLLHSLDSFIKIIKQTPENLQLNNRIREEFLVFKAGGRKDLKEHKMLVTGYYEPLFEGRLDPVPPYIHPLYSPPETLVKTGSEASGDRTVGRYDESKRFVPFWTRYEIETSDVLTGNELVYLKDPFDAFLIHVQGSGRIQLAGGAVQSVRFAGHNGHPYNSIGKLLVDEKKIKLKESSVPVIRDYLARHPDDLQRVLHHNPRYIFFEWGNNAPPRGSTGVSLTPGRSIAIDQQILPETVSYLITRKPVVDSNGKILGWVPLTRFVMPQDSGNAIKGPGRVDLFFGSGTYAEIAASHTAEEGELYFLVKKGYISKEQDGQ